MNSDNLKQQQFFGEHTQIDGNSGKKQTSTQNLPSHNYGDQGHQSIPVGQAHQSVQGHQSIPVGQAGNVPSGHGHAEGHKTEHGAEHVHISLGQAGSGNVEQVIRIKPDGDVQVTAEKVEEHQKPLSKEVTPGKEQAGTAGYDREGKLGKHDDTHYGKKDFADTHHHGTEHERGTVGYEGKLGKHDDTHYHGKKDFADTHHHGTKETTVGTTRYDREGKLGKHDDTHHGKKDFADTHHHGTQHERGTVGYDREGQLGKHDDTHHGKKDFTDTHHHGTEHERGTAGYEGKLGKHDDTHHGKKDFTDTHHHGTKETTVGTAGYDREGKLGKHDDTHHGKKDHHGILGKKDHADTHHHGTKETTVGTTGYDREGKLGKHDDTHHHGTDEPKVKVYKSDNTTVVKVSDNEPGTAGHVKGGKHHHGTGATKVDKDIE